MGCTPGVTMSVCLPGTRGVQRHGMHAPVPSRQGLLCGRGASGGGRGPDLQEDKGLHRYGCLS